MHAHSITVLKLHSAQYVSASALAMNCKPRGVSFQPHLFIIWRNRLNIAQKMNAMLHLERRRVFPLKYCDLG